MAYKKGRKRIRFEVEAEAELKDMDLRGNK